MKLNASTHITIIFTFALIFVVIYLYYTIIDVRKINTDISKVTKELQSLTTSVSKLNSDIAEIQKTNQDVTRIFNMNDILTQEINNLMPMVNKLTDNVIPEFPFQSYPLGESERVECTDNVCVIPNDEDDKDSVDTVDIKKILNDDDNDSVALGLDEIVKESITEVTPSVIEVVKATKKIVAKKK
jgi:cell division protein FtsB